MLVIKQFGPVTYAMGTLQEILAGTGIAAKVRALPNDVAGCTLEMGADGLWTGNLGTLTQAQEDALVAAGVMGNVKTGTPAEINGTHVRWTGTAWQSGLIVGPFTNLDAANAWAAANPSLLFPGLLATAAGVQIRWGGVEVGWVPVAPLFVSRQVRFGTFGDSENYAYAPYSGGTELCDMETIVQTLPSAASWVEYVTQSVGNIQGQNAGLQIVANGGIIGQTSAQAIARSALAASASRKAIQDVTAKGLDIAIVNGLSINDIQNLPEGSDHTAIDAAIANTDMVISILSMSSKFVIHTGIFAFNNTTYTPERNAMIREMITYSWVRMAENAKKYGNVIFISPKNILATEDANWLPRIALEQTGAQLHLSARGGMVHAQKIIDVSSALVTGEFAAMNAVGDFRALFAVPASGRPSGVIIAGIGTGVIGAATTTLSKYSQIVTVSDSASGAIITFPNLKAQLAGLVSGDRVKVRFQASVVDSNGAASTFITSPQVRLYESTNTYYRAMTLNDCEVAKLDFVTPALAFSVDPSTLGAGSSLRFSIRLPKAGAYTITIFPPIITKV